MATLFEKKKVLFICPPFFGYDKIVVKELKLMGASVDLISDRPYNLLYVILRNVSISLLCWYQRLYWKKCSKLLEENSYDFLFVIRGESTSKDFLTFFHERNPRAKRIMYQWDSVSNHNYLPYIPFFDKVYSFDKNDSSAYNNIIYLPLFYRREYGLLARSEAPNDQALFIGSYQDARYKTLKVLKEEFSLKKLKFNVFLFVPWYLYLKLLVSGIVLDLRIVCFRTLSFDRVLKLYGEATIIVDIANERQSGLTMRTMEALGSNRMLLTNNINIKAETFFSDDRICIIGEDFNRLSSMQFEKIPTFEIFRIDYWLCNLFFENDD